MRFALIIELAINNLKCCWRALTRDDKLESSHLVMIANAVILEMP